MMLGDVLRDAHRACALLDPALTAAIAQAGEPPDAFARAAVASFERDASEEDWATLLSSIRTVERPGLACLEAMVRWQLRRMRAARNDADIDDEARR